LAKNNQPPGHTDQLMLLTSCERLI